MLALAAQKAGIAVKLVAYSAGRKNGNTEVLIKEALMAAEEMGVEVGLVRLNEYVLAPCRACRSCAAGQGPDKCILGDDGALLVETFLDSDGYILGAPVWSLSPPGIVTVFRDRVFGPKMDIAGPEVSGREPAWVRGRFRARPGALISVGGAHPMHWVSLGIATQYTTTFSAQTDIVDLINANRSGGPAGSSALRGDLVLRARQLGQHVAYAMLHPEEPHHWMGPDLPHACPGCHMDLIMFRQGAETVECAICGRKGYLRAVDGKVYVDFPQGDENDRLSYQGKLTHMLELAGRLPWQQTQVPARPVLREELEAALSKYVRYEACIVPSPTREAEQARSASGL
jgi:LSD1 subclass zinc finger protein